MNTVLSLIIMISQNTIRKDNFNSIACYIIEHLYEIETMNIKYLAENCFVSTTSILKFCQLIGFDSYTDFKKNLFTSIDTRKEQLIAKCENLNEQELLHKISLFAKEPFDIKQLQEQVHQLIQFIKNQKRIHFYGAVFPLGLLESFSEDMTIMGVPIYVHQTPYNQIELKANKGIHVIVTLTGRFIELNQDGYLKLCHSHEHIVLISQMIDLKNAELNIHMPYTISSDYDDIIYILILDLIKYLYYQRVGLKI
ncbi:MurR/RpiR family transcriptional regulator [Candidatus Stoquefichus massiliensis]|uniref:MurR/RpiR family transcriptional regulator n=1 Tax=Candidatus Stoquefichus massiliensis TaxID=1470350 RepID=UPI000483BC97|nr:MurR/RpiR family transcriptional regulator [Candidatus Stoquefichus massiliensis]